MITTEEIVFVLLQYQSPPYKGMTLEEITGKFSIRKEEIRKALLRAEVEGAVMRVFKGEKEVWIP